MKNLNKYVINLICFSFILILYSCAEFSSSHEPTERIKSSTKDSITHPSLTVSKNITENDQNTQIIKQLKSFFKKKNDDLRAFEYWKDADFDDYIFPYFDIINIEKSNYYNGYFYKPTLLEIIDVRERPNRKLLKIAFIGNEENGTYLKAIYNLFIDTTDLKFERPLKYNTQNWDSFKVGMITYYSSPSRDFNMDQAFLFSEINKEIAALFNQNPKEIIYYACTDPRQIFEIKGFDYIPNMYMGATGGLSETTSNIIFSGNNSEIYTHELVHSYLDPTYHKTITNLLLLSEGLATYIGGSGNKSYRHLRDRLKLKVDDEDLLLSDYIHPYYNTQENNEISYTVGALLCERAIRILGSDKFLEIFRSSDINSALKSIGINSENLNEELKNELMRSPLLAPNSLELTL